MVLLRESPDDLLALCGAAADALSIPEPAFVEKDFWVVELLRSVVRPLDLEPVNNTPCSATVMFKGGTSLSKAFGLIQRFSEDIDILIKCEGYGDGAREKRVLWPICERARTDLGLSSDQLIKLQYKTGFTRNAVSYIAAAGIEADYEELAPVDVQAIAPVRTLAEKLALLHHAGRLAEQGQIEPLQRAGRHFYDIHQLLRSRSVIAQLSAPGQTMEVLAADVDAKSDEFGWGHTPRPGDGYAASLVFASASELRDVAEEAYTQALSLVWGEHPTFDQCLTSIADAGDLL